MRDLSEIVKFLIQHGADIESAPLNSRFEMTPGELACTFGHHDVLKVLLKDSKLKFKHDKSRSNLLHVILASKNVNEVDRQKCFDLIISDHRCTLDIINERNEVKQTPLTLLNGFSEIAKELIKRGADIGHKSTIDNIDRDLLQDFLDDCLTCTSSDISDKNCVVHIDYKFLMSPTVHKKRKSEMKSIFSMAESENFDDLLLHPVVSTFVELKCRKISYLVYFNLLVHFCCLVFRFFE